MLAIDHIVIAAKDPAQAAHDFERKYRVTTVQGGKHDNWGTYNYVAYFENDCYMEWIGIFDEGIAKKSTNPLIKQLVSAFHNKIEGIIQFALRTEKMDNYIDHFDATGVKYAGPVPGSRKRPDGSTLQWRMLFPEPETALPFLIEWGEVKNIPQDERLVNKQHLRSITFGMKEIEVFKHIYQLDSRHHPVKLENGILHLAGSKQLDFQIA